MDVWTDWTGWKSAGFGIDWTFYRSAFGKGWMVWLSLGPILVSFESR